MMDIRLILDIEAELGALPLLAGKFRSGQWTVGELVALTQMMLQQSGETEDFIDLGNRMLQQGLGIYVARVVQFLDEALGV